jgi:hypothetical protein
MAWTDRLREAAYTSPSGNRLRFDYESVSRETPLRSTAFEFPNVDGGYVQQNGHGPRRYPLRCIFWGADHDIAATRFEAALLERGLGKLEHPLYGTFTVVPLGDISRRDDLKDAANQTIIEVTFVTTLGAVYPASAIDPKNEILAQLEAFDAAVAQQFEDVTNLDGVLNQSNGMATIRGMLLSVSAALESVSAATTSVNREFRDLQSTVNLGLDVLIGQPLQLAQQISNLIKAPARALAGILDRLAGYERLASSIFGSDATDPETAFATGTFLLTRRERVANDFHIADLFATNAVAGSVASTTETTFATKPEAINAAASVLTQFDELVTWRDAGFEALKQPTQIGPYQVDTGASYQALQQAVALTAGYLIEVSFSLVPERRIVLDRNRTIVDLAAELYGTVDDRLDFLIMSNGLTGSEILELQRGKTIKYYA